jgi:hypothetical protein
MSVVLETGTADNPLANSLISLTELAEYWAARGDTSYGTLTEDELSAPIQQAHDYLVRKFGTRFRGRRVSVKQPLPFPRTALIDVDGMERPEDEVPVEVKVALAILVGRTVAGETLLVDVTVDPAGRVKRSRSKVGDLETEVEYADGAAPTATSAQKVLTEVDLTLAPLLKGAGMGRIAVMRG